MRDPSPSGRDELPSDRANAAAGVETSADGKQEQGHHPRPTTERSVDGGETDDGTQPVGDAPTGGVDVAGESEPENPVAPA